MYVLQDSLNIWILTRYARLSTIDKDHRIPLSGALGLISTKLKIIIP